MNKYMNKYMNEENEEIEPYYQIKAKQIIDKLFEAKIFADRITRDDMKTTEDVIAICFKNFDETSKTLIEFSLRERQKEQRKDNKAK